MDHPGAAVEHEPKPDRPVWFVGDLDDPWVAAIARSLPARTNRVHCVGDLPDAIIASAVEAGCVLVLHRPVLTRHDAARVSRFRTLTGPEARVILCHGPHVRHADLERWADIIDIAVPEATARETLWRRLPDGDAREVSKPGGPRPRVAVISTNWALRQALAEALEVAGYPVTVSKCWDEARGPTISVWDVPLLEPDWADRLGRHSNSTQVVALMGFPDRGLVTLAHDRGASACLELPVDIGDLVAVIDRLATTRVEPAHAVPPAPASRSRAAAERPSGSSTVARKAKDA